MSARAGACGLAFVIAIACALPGLAASAPTPIFSVPVTFESQFKGSGPGECGVDETLTLERDGIAKERFEHDGREIFRDSGPWHFEAGGKILRLGAVVDGDYYAAHDAVTLVQYAHNGKPFGTDLECRTILTKSPWVVTVDASRHWETLESISWQLVALDGHELVRPVEEILPTLAFDVHSHSFSLPSRRCGAVDAAFTSRLVRAVDRTRSFDWCCEHLHMLDGKREVARFRTMTGS